MGNHAYMNSDFSPYQGQQHESVSQNLQASAINKMVTGNRGELGKSAIPDAMKNKLKQLQNLEDKTYKRYESLSNKIIKRIGEQQMKETGTVVASGTSQQLANCFRCTAVGSTNPNCQQTWLQMLRSLSQQSIGTCLKKMPKLGKPLCSYTRRQWMPYPKPSWMQLHLALYIRWA